jgi:phospholipid/cholesterol/gamma-HCH transport system substrate-binding protein
MADHPKRTQFIAGIFVLCGLVLLGGLILEFGPLKHWLRRPYTVHAVFSDAQSLIKGSPVRHAGSQIGKVSTSPELLSDLRGVRVSLDIYPEFEIPEKSQLRIINLGLMGDCAVDVIPPPPDQRTGKSITAGTTLEGTGGNDLTTAASKVADESVIVMKDVRAGIAKLNETLERIQSGLLSEENLRHISESLASINESLEKFDNRILSEENVVAVRDSLALLKTTMQNANSASGKADSAFSKADSALAKADKAMDHLGPGLKGFSGATASLDDAANALEALLKEARSGRGVLYAILNDRVLADNLERLIENLRRSGPFFYKDRAPSSLAPPAPAPVKPRTPR